MTTLLNVAKSRIIDHNYWSYKPSMLLFLEIYHIYLVHDVYAQIFSFHASKTI